MDIERSASGWLRRLGIGGVAAGMVLAVTGVALTSAGAAPGNNGTIKVDEQGLENGPGAPNSNDPHIDCVGRVEWYGFDEGVQSSDVTFEVQAPTSGTGTPNAATSKTYEDVAIVDGDGPGGTSLDGTLDFDLTDLLADYTPHPQQGYHVKVTAHTTFAQGSDVKHKVFWVGPCPGAPAPPVDDQPVVNPVVTPTPPPAVLGEVVTPGAPGAPEQPATVDAPAQPETAVLGNVVARPASPEPAVLGNVASRPAQLARTGNDALPLVQVGLGMVLLGAGAVLFGRERPAIV